MHRDLSTTLEMTEKKRPLEMTEKKRPLEMTEKKRPLEMTPICHTDRAVGEWSVSAREYAQKQEKEVS